ncbi:MAG: type II toxin-antitoxin system PemK/MazF family toxin [Propionibacteriaceae bacterium]|jgi:mRNA interferase MazF|nr:type II toxin-antitoxin system PemK/MazF family toxin [Propionibacteriaceae bacterium]
MRGDIWELRAPRDAQGHEQKGRRYAVEVQSDDLLLSTKLVAPTSSSARPTSFRPETTIDGAKTLIMVEQTAVVDPEARLGGFAGRLDAAELAAVDRALRVVLGLRH